MYSDENKSSVLAKFINGFDYVLIDTCSLMDDAFPEWMDALRGAKDYRKKTLEILVPRRCYDELKKHARQSADDSKRIDAKRGLKILRSARWHRLLSITKKDDNGNFADNWIYVKVSTDRLFSKILIITQDKSLATDLRRLNLLRSQNGRPIEVCKLVTGGKLVPNTGDERSSKEHRGTGHLVKATPGKTVKIVSTKAAEDVVLADAKLSAVINNATYPPEKRRADAIAQIEAIEKLPETLRSSLKLLVPMAKLKELAKAPKKAEAPAKPEEKPAKPEPKVEKKSEPKVETKEAKQPETKSKEKLWYGTGATMKDGFLDCASHYGIAFHEPSVLYFKDAHGPLDLTTVDLDNLVALGMSLLKGEEKISFLYRGMTLLTQKTPDKFKCWIDVNLLPKAPLPLSKTDKPKETKPEPVVVTEAPVQPEPKPKAPKATKPAKPKAKAEPKSEPKEETPAPAAKKPRKKKVEPAGEPAAKSAEPSPAEPAPKEEKKPAPKKRKKAAKPEEKPAVEAETPAKPEEKPAPKKAAKTKAVKKPAEPKAEDASAKPEKPAISKELTKARTAERKLRANIPNPNYPNESKVKDLEAFLELMGELTPDEAKTLKYAPEAIRALIADLKKGN